MGKNVAPWREGLLLKITEGGLAGFTGTVVVINDDHILMVDEGTRETHWFDTSSLNRDYGMDKWFEWIETAKTPIEILDDLILDWDRNWMDAHWKYKDVVGVLQEAKNRIQSLK